MPNVRNVGFPLAGERPQENEARFLDNVREGTHLEKHLRDETLFGLQMDSGLGF